MAATSAGILLYRIAGGSVEVLLVHPGGPFWARKDLGAWSIPKGMPDQGEDLLVAARREFQEETGFAAEGLAVPLGAVQQANGKIVHAWAIEGDLDVRHVKSNTFEMEWPRGSGRMRSFPEVDRAEWFTPEEARRRLVPAQAALVDALTRVLRN